MVQQEYTHCLKSSNANVERVHFSFMDFQVKMGETINGDFNSV